MRKNIIQSKTEPNKNDIWLSEEGLKRYGKNGWESLGSGVINDSTPVSDKELFVITPTPEGEFPTILTKDYLNSGMPVFSFGGMYITKTFSRTYHDMDTDYYEDYYIMTYGIHSGDKSRVLIVNYRPNKPNNPVNFNMLEASTVPFLCDGDGTKFLSDNGTYKEVSGGSGPVIIEYPFEGTEAVTLTDEQINAVKNSNIKIKLTISDNSAYVIMLPEFYEISDEGACISFYQPNVEGVRSNVVYVVDITNKTMTKE